MKKELSDSEWILMKKLWDEAPMTITQLTTALNDETQWTKQTVISLLSRMETKGAIRYEQGKRAKEYYPILQKESAQKEETESFIKRVYDGNIGLLMNAITNSYRFSNDDIVELSAILEQAREKEKK